MEFDVGSRVCCLDSLWPTIEATIVAVDFGDTYSHLLRYDEYDADRHSGMGRGDAGHMWWSAPAYLITAGPPCTYKQYLLDFEE